MTATVPGASSAVTLRGAPVTGGLVNASVAGAAIGANGQIAAAGATMGTCMVITTSVPEGHSYTLYTCEE